MLSHIPFPALPSPPSWFPGHMNRFTKQLPALLSRTDVVLELRDARLPLTSINNHLEGPLRKWKVQRGRPTHLSAPFLKQLSSLQSSPAPLFGGPICERIVVVNKCDLVPEWGFEPFRRAMASRFSDQRMFFLSGNKPRDVKALSDLLVSIAKGSPHATEMNVLVVGMPNVGKSTLLNSLRSMGISGRTQKALQTSGHPGHTRTLSTRLKLSEEPLVYSYDSPGVMLPYLGAGEKGAERGVKLALIAGIKEGLYDVEALAAYVLYRLNVLNPISPAYLELLPPSTSPTTDVYEFLEQLARRLGMLQRGGNVDRGRAAKWFVKWWREEGGFISASVPRTLKTAPYGQSHTPGSQSLTRGWGFDFEWTVDTSQEYANSDDVEFVQSKMEECIDKALKSAEEEEGLGNYISATQKKKQTAEEERAKRIARSKMKLAARRGVLS